MLSSVRQSVASRRQVIPSRLVCNNSTLGIIYPGFRIRIFFFADPDPDPDPGKNFHADPDPVPDPDPGGIRGRGLGVKGKNDFFFEFFSRFR